ncbi:MAG: DNA replication/repair protein RecF [Bacteroidota bacterium]
MQTIHIQHFKNISEADIAFKMGINFITGSNGMGKTNILDAVHYLCISKSYFLHQDRLNIQFSQKQFTLQGSFLKNQQLLHVSCMQTHDSKKIFKVNRKAYERLSEHLGVLPVVMICPADADLITGTSEHRRRFLDQLLMQSDAVYFKHFTQYLHFLKQRNALLRNAQHQQIDMEVLRILDAQLVLHAQIVWQKREALTQYFKTLFQNLHRQIIHSGETAEFIYSPSTDPNLYAAELIQSLPKDRILGYTCSGPHKDDIELQFQGVSYRKFGSQGQQKSCIIAIKLAQYHYLKQKLHCPPILLIDDFSDKLDAMRLLQVLEILKSFSETQILISDTQIPSIFKSHNTHHHIHIENGSITTMNSNQHQ